MVQFIFIGPSSPVRGMVKRIRLSRPSRFLNSIIISRQCAISKEVPGDLNRFSVNLHEFVAKDRSVTFRLALI